MKKSVLFLMMIMAAANMAACSQDDIKTDQPALLQGEDCDESKPCIEPFVCAHGVCMEPDDPCVRIECEDGIVCRNGECQGFFCGENLCRNDQACQNNECRDLCGNRVCTDAELCVQNECRTTCGGVVCDDGKVCLDEKCVIPGDCGGIACEEDEICHLDVCHAAGDCGGMECLENETCYDGRCHAAGDCGGMECLEDETCHDDACMPSGDCGGIQCPEGLACDYVSMVCKPIGDCGGVDCGENSFCMFDLCYDKVQCGDIYCEGGDECIDGKCQKTFCLDGTDLCGTSCCTNAQFCGTKAHCCNKAESCGQDCCSNDQICVNEACHIKCDEGISRCTKTDGSEICCGKDEICVSNKCFKPKVTCVDDYQCETTEYCETTEHICLPQPTGPVCEAKPTGGAVQPTVDWHWGNGALAPEFQPNHIKVMSAPMVADIDGDGNTEVVFNSWYDDYVGGGILRIIDGKTGKTRFSSNGNPLTDGGSQTAIGDIRKDIPGLEIVTCVKSGDYFKIAMYNNKAELIWVSKTGNYNECGQSGPGIADFNGDGTPEIYSRYNVYDAQGNTIARVSCGDTAYWHQECDYPTHADIDGDGLPELVGGNVVYKVDFQNKKLNPVWQRTDQKDGYPAVADLDLKGDPEIVVVRPNDNTLMAYKKDGSNFWSAPVKHTAEVGGPPTIANLDNTPNPEITFAGKWSYIAFNYDGSVKWQKRTHDFSSSKTGSSVFDFDGDGKAEVVYADECFLRVYNGDDGKVRYCQRNTNGTHWEYPVIADINNDNHAEILVSANPYYGCKDMTEDSGIDECTKPLIDAGALNEVNISGLRAFSSPKKDWVPTRKIYNQHAYSITNVSDDGTIPMKIRNNWTTKNLNNFRLNVQPGATYLPDLEIKNLSAPRVCTDSTPIYFTVLNVGWAAAKPGITVHVFASDKEEGPFNEIGTVKTTKLLRATESESLKFDYDKSLIDASIIYFKLQFGKDAPTECQTGNNSANYTLNCTVIN